MILRQTQYNRIPLRCGIAHCRVDEPGPSHAIPPSHQWSDNAIRTREAASDDKVRPIAKETGHERDVRLNASTVQSEGFKLPDLGPMVTVLPQHDHIVGNPTPIESPARDVQNTLVDYPSFYPIKRRIRIATNPTSWCLGQGLDREGVWIFPKGSQPQIQRGIRLRSEQLLPLHGGRNFAERLRIIIQNFPVHRGSGGQKNAIRLPTRESEMEFVFGRL